MDFYKKETAITKELYPHNQGFLVNFSMSPQENMHMLVFADSLLYSRAEANQFNSDFASRMISRKSRETLASRARCRQFQVVLFTGYMANRIGAFFCVI